MRNFRCFALSLRQIVVASLAALAISSHSGDLQAIPMPMTDLMLWLDAQDVDGDGNSGNDPIAGTPVMTWADKSGNGYDAVQPTSGKRPLFQPLEFNGMPALVYDGSDDLSPLPSTTIVNQWSAFFVWNLKSTTGGGYALTDHPFTFLDGTSNPSIGGAGTGLEIGVNGGGSANTLDIFGGFGNDTRGTLTNIAGTNYERMLDWTSASTHTTLMWHNGNDVPETITGTNNTPWSFRLGGGTSGNNFGVGGIEWVTASLFAHTNEAVAELIVYDAILSTNDRQLVEGILAWKWGLQGDLPTNHPYFNLNPNVEVAIPEPSTLALLGLGVIGLAIRHRRRRTAA